MSSIMVATLLVLAGCDTPAGEPSPSPEATPTGESRPTTFAPAVQRVRPAVVNLYSVSDDNEKTTLGSGILIDDGAWVLTNAHVVRDRTAIRARLSDGTTFDVRIQGMDSMTDVALLEVRDPPTELPSAPLGESESLQVGDWVIAIGNPLGLTSTVTAGVTSGVGRSNLPLSEEMRYQRFIQTDASINPGNSGGPLVDSTGNVIGLNTAMSSKAQGLGFAIPIDMVRDILPHLKEKGRVERSSVGLYIKETPPALRRELELDARGVLVTGLREGGPAEKAGLKKGDVIVEYAGEPVDGIAQISWISGLQPAGEPVEAVVQRGGSRKTFELVPTQSSR
jgi:serine protease Do